MAQGNKYARFFALIKHFKGDQKEIKEDLVYNFTGGRTNSLKALSQYEYKRLCDQIEATVIKPLRSAVLLRMSRMGINTADWKKVDEFCRNPRITKERKVFRELTPDELTELIPKLEAILRKSPGSPAQSLVPDPEPDPIPTIYIVSPPNQLPN